MRAAMNNTIQWTALGALLLLTACSGGASFDTNTRDASPPTIHDDGGAGPTPTDAQVSIPRDAAPAPSPRDSGAPTPQPARDAGAVTPPPTPPPPTPPPPTAACPVAAHRLWFDDFETNDHRNWTGHNYAESWGNTCDTTELSTESPRAGAGRYVQRSDNTCGSVEDVHRGYGGLQFSGETVAPEFTNTGAGFSAPNGMVSTFYVWFHAGYPFGGGRWVNFFSVFPACDYSERMITLGLDEADGILRPAHYWPEGSIEISPGAPPMPSGQWVRITVYLNYATGDMHVWQNGQSVVHARGIVRSDRMCQFHWGLYSSGDNDDLLLYEDDKSVWKLDAPLTDSTREPWLDESCEP